jgi:ABC-2 type transport system ATP-binding protein
MTNTATPPSGPNVPPPPLDADRSTSPQPAPSPSLTGAETIHVHDVSKAFGALVAVSDVTFSVGPGVTGLLGPNGAGKSTLMRVLCGLTPPSTGSVWVAGGDPRTDAASRAQIGLVPQQDGIFERETVFDFVKLAARLTGVADVDAATHRALDAVELPADLDRPMGAFSKGMRQRGKIAAALVNNPAVLVLDEPLNGLDPRQRRQMIDLFHRLGAAGHTVLVSSHVLEEVERFGSRILVMAKGRLAAQGDFRAIRRLMNDQPLTYRVGCSEPNRVGAALLAESLITSCQITGPDTVEVTTTNSLGFRRRLPAVCREANARFAELIPLDEDLESVFRYLVGPT